MWKRSEHASMGTSSSRRSSNLRSCCAPRVRRVTATAGKEVREVRRLGKQIAIGVEGDLWLVIHLMIAGRLHWKTSSAQTRQQEHPGRVRIRQRLALADRSGHAAARGASRGRRRSGPSVFDCRRYRTTRRESRGVRLGATVVQSYAEAIAHRPAHFQWHRQRVLRRDSASCATFADRDDAEVDRR